MKRYILLAVLLVPNIALAQTAEQLVNICKVQMLAKYDNEFDLMIRVRDISLTCACIVNRKLQRLSPYDCPSVKTVEIRVLRSAGFSWD
jgi:hypothetical protein